jgi:hypothetical protein
MEGRKRQGQLVEIQVSSFFFYNFIKNCETCCCNNYCRTVACDSVQFVSRLRLKRDGTCAETRFSLSAKRASPFKSAGGASVQTTTGSRGVRISGSNAGYTIFRGSVKGSGYPLHSPVSPSPPARQRVSSHFNLTLLIDVYGGTCGLHLLGTHNVVSWYIQKGVKTAQDREHNF